MVAGAGTNLCDGWALVQQTTRATVCRALFVDRRLSAFGVWPHGQASGPPLLAGDRLPLPPVLPLNEPWSGAAEDLSRFVAWLDRQRALNLLHDCFDEVRTGRDGAWSARCPGPGAPHRLMARPEIVHGRPGVTVSCSECGDRLADVLRRRCGLGMLVNPIAWKPPR